MAAMDTSMDTFGSSSKPNVSSGWSWQTNTQAVAPGWSFNQPAQSSQPQIPTFQWGNLFTQPTQVQAQAPQFDTQQAETVKNHFNKINICSGVFAEVFHYLFTAVPDVARSYQPTKHIKILQGSVKFDAKHEQNFIKQIALYNSLPSAKFVIEYKKDLAASTVYIVVYNLQFSGK